MTDSQHAPYNLKFKWFLTPHIKCHNDAGTRVQGESCIPLPRVCQPAEQQEMRSNISTLTQMRSDMSRCNKVIWQRSQSQAASIELLPDFDQHYPHIAMSDVVNGDNESMTLSRLEKIRVIC